MRWIWLIALIILGAALAAVVWPHGTSPTTQGAPEPPIAATAASSAPDQRAATSAQPSTAPPARALPPASALTQLVGSDPADAGAIELTPGPPATVERIDDQTVRLDHAYTLRGTGSERDPYQVTWELLGSANGPIDAPEHRYQLPGRLGSLQDAWVQVSGYWAPPLQRFETREIMVMLNKWDGCCIGKPPTPFDSIEVNLAAPLSIAGQHMFRYGTVRGRLRIMPFAAGPYLLGLYRLDDAVLESS